jgi:hypothetical protein
MYDRKVVKSQAAAASMIPMNCSTFNYHYNGRNFKEQQSLNALEDNLILERCMVFSMPCLRQRSWQIKELALDIRRIRDPNCFVILEVIGYLRNCKHEILRFLFVRRKKSINQQKTKIGYLSQKSPLRKLKSV